MDRPYPATAARRYTITGLIIGLAITASAFSAAPALQPLRSDPLVAAAFLIVPALAASSPGEPHSARSPPSCQLPPCRACTPSLTIAPTASSSSC